MENKEQILFGQRRRIIIEQTIGFGKIIEVIRDKYKVSVFSEGNGGEEIYLIEEKEKAGA